MKPTTPIPVWGRVPYKHIEKVERALPQYGWRSRLIVHVFAHLAARVSAGSQPSMHTLEQIATLGADEWLARYGGQYAQAKPKRKKN